MWIARETYDFRRISRCRWQKNLLSSMESTLGGLTGDTEMNLDDITVDLPMLSARRIKMPLYGYGI